MCVCLYIQYVCKYANKASPPKKIEHVKAGNHPDPTEGISPGPPRRLLGRSTTKELGARDQGVDDAKVCLAALRHPNETQMSAALLGKSLGTLW